MMIDALLRGLLSLFFIAAGTSHFIHPDGFVAIVPDYLPAPLALVYISRFFEVLGGIGLMVPRVSRWAAWCLVALLIAVFPANIHMAIHNLPVFGKQYPIFSWVRLPLQFVLIAWAWRFTRRKTANDAEAEKVQS